MDEYTVLCHSQILLTPSKKVLKMGHNRLGLAID